MKTTDDIREDLELIFEHLSDVGCWEKMTPAGQAALDSIGELTAKAEHIAGLLAGDDAPTRMIETETPQPTLFGGSI